MRQVVLQCARIIQLFQQVAELNLCYAHSIWYYQHTTEWPNGANSPFCNMRISYMGSAMCWFHSFCALVFCNTSAPLTRPSVARHGRVAINRKQSVATCERERRGEAEFGGALFANAVFSNCVRNRSGLSAECGWMSVQRETNPPVHTGGGKEFPQDLLRTW